MNSFEMTGTSRTGEGSYITMKNYRADAEIEGNTMIMSSAIESPAFNSIVMYNYQHSSATRILANSFIMSSNTSGNNILLQNYNSSGTLLNAIQLNSDGTVHITSNSTMNIISHGRVDITSNSSQDIRLISSDDIHIQSTDKIYLTGSGVYFNNTQKW